MRRTRLSSLVASVLVAIVSAEVRAADPDAAPPAAPGEASPDVSSEGQPSADASPNAQSPSPDPDAMRRIKVGAVLGGVGVLLGATAGGLTHYALTPPCADAEDILECAPPSAGDIGDRRVAIGIGGTAAVAGPILGALGGGRFTRGLAELSTEANTQKRSKIMLGVGAGTLSLGLVQTIAGVTMLTVGLGGALEPVDDSDGSEAQDDTQRTQIKDRLRDVRVARSGLALFLAAPTFIATGAAILWRKKKHFDRRTFVSFSVSDSYQGAVVSGRF